MRAHEAKPVTLARLINAMDDGWLLTLTVGAETSGDEDLAAVALRALHGHSLRARQTIARRILSGELSGAGLDLS